MSEALKPILGAAVAFSALLGLGGPRFPQLAVHSQKMEDCST